MLLNINTTATKEHVIRLGEINKSALPVVIRQVLNKAAYDVKMNTMPAEAGVFIHRKPTFFQANSKVRQATGLDISSMKSEVGFIPKADAKDSSVQDLEQQEHGGDISGRAFVPLKEDRTGSTWQGNVRSAGRTRVFAGKIFDSKNAPGKTDAEKYVQTAMESAKVGGIVIGNKKTSRGNKIAWRVQNLNRFFGNTYVVATPLFAVKAGRKVAPPPTHFMEKASIKSAGKMERDFIALAEIKLNSLK